MSANVGRSKTLYRRAGAGSRLSAYILDWLIQTACLLMLVLLSVNAIIDDFDFSLITVKESLPSFLLAAGFSYFVTGFIYDLIGDLLFDGVTFGKKVFGLKVYGDKNEKPTFARAALRSLVKHTIDTFTGLFSVMFSYNRSSVADIITGTKVVARKVCAAPVDFPRANIDIIDPAQKERLTLTDYEFAILRELFLRQQSLDDGGRALHKLLQKRFSRKFDIPLEELNDKALTVLLAINSSVRG